jgi:hypothetical protein
MIDHIWERNCAKHDAARAILTDQNVVDQFEVDYIRVYQQQ